MVCFAVLTLCFYGHPFTDLVGKISAFFLILNFFFLVYLWLLTFHNLCSWGCDWMLNGENLIGPRAVLHNSQQRFWWSQKLKTTWPFCEGIHTALPSHCILYIQNHTKRGWALCIVIFVDGSIVDSDIYVSQVAFLWSLFSGLFFSLFLLDYLYSLLSSQISKRGYQSGFIYFGRINWLLTNSIDNLCQ